jgi:hypothetical protein
MTKRPRAFHPFLIALFPILMLYSKNLHTIDCSETFLPIALSLVATILAWSTLRALRLDGPRASLIVSAGLLLFFSFGPGVRVLDRLGIASSRLGREWLALAFESLGMAGVVALALKKPEFARASTGFGNASAMALVGLSAFGIVKGIGLESGQKPPNAAERPLPVFSRPAGRLPDVYFVVLDAYGRSDALKEVIGFDNSEFLARLEQKGFFIARQSTSNYCQTALSLSSTLNLQYLDDLAGSPSDDRRPLKRLIADNVVFRGFKSLGYRVVRFDSGFDATESIAGDLNLGPPGNLRTFPAMIADQTPLWLLLGSRSIHQPQRLHRERILKVFDDLPSSNHPSDLPTFTFAHVLAPHPPFLFGKDGCDCSDREGTYTLNDNRIDRDGGSEEYARRYRDQVEYLTGRVEEVVSRILATSKVEPIIIIQGDHGSGSRFDADADEPNGLFERMTVLNAIYLPEAHRGAIDPAITLVNTFRLVFDRCFGSKLGLLDDRNYYSAYPRPYVFTEVTGKINRSVPMPEDRE